jgi:hypothetical protein
MQFFTLFPNITSKLRKKNKEHGQILEILESEQKGPKMRRYFQTMLNNNRLLSKMYMKFELTVENYIY